MPADSEPRPRVTLPQGTVVGITQKGPYPNPVDAFLGIPYAQPPTGDRRFRPPVKVERDVSGEKIIDASRFGPRAPAKQFLIIGPKLEESEDCLTANVFRPAGSTEEKKLLPVAIYMHGGAFNRGNAAMHDTASMVGWAAPAAPFVAVSFGYRIGALGFLPSSLSAKEGALNLGLKDQIVLMEWVRDNIHLFGGDKDNVTLIGLSAGAHSIGHHLLDYEEGKQPLFHRAVMESGAPTSRAVRHFDAEIHEQQFQDFLDAVQCPTTAQSSSEEVFKYLRSLPIETIAAAQTKVFYAYNPSLRWAFQPVIDCEIIRRRPIDAWRQGLWHRVPILTGFNGNEGSLYVDKAMDTSEQFTQFWKTLLPQLSDDDVRMINELYPDPITDPTSPYKVEGPLAEKDGIGKMYKRIEAAYAHYAYVAPARQTAHLASAGGGDKAGVPVYLYHWALQKTLINGAAHGENMLYEVRDPDVCAASQAQDALARVLHAYVTSFICTGDPNGVAEVERPRWEAHDRGDGGDGKRMKMVFGQGNEEFVGDGKGKPPPPPAELVEDVWAGTESAFWWDKVEISQQ